MVISDEQLEQFRVLYRRRYGKDISREDAYEQGMKLLVMLKCIYKPMTKEAFDRIQERRRNTLPAILSELASQDENSMA